MARHLTAYQKACREIETEGRKQCYLLYSATSLALSRHWNKGRKAIANLFLITQDMWNECAKDNMHSMIEMCEKETGIEIQAQYNMDQQKILQACREETGICIQEIVTQK